MSFSKTASLCTALVALAMFFGIMDAFAANKGPVAVAGKEIRTKYFEIKIPEGWVMPRQTRTSKRGVEAIFANQKAETAVQLTVLEISASAKNMAIQTAKDMRAKKLDASDPVEAGDGFYVMDVQGGPMPYRCWVGANGKLATLTIVMGGDYKVGNEILEVVKSKPANMFPKSVN